MKVVSWGLGPGWDCPVLLSCSCNILFCCGEINKVVVFQSPLVPSAEVYSEFR